MAVEVLDLGELEGDVLLYGGPYSNLQATRALFDEADQRGIPRERRICTGDIVAYCADPIATLRLVATEGGPVVAGNTERQLAAGAEDCGCGFEDGSTCNILSKGWYSKALRAVLSAPEVLPGITGLPDMAVFSHSGLRIAVIHGGLTDIARFIWPSSPEAVFAEEVAAITEAAGPVDMVVAGHAGIAFHRPVAGVQWFNAGVIGMPQNNGTPQTRFLTIGEDGVQLEALSYDYRAAATAMRAAGLTQGYEAALDSGWWPSEDVLPKELRRVSTADDAPAPAT